MFNLTHVRIARKLPAILVLCTLTASGIVGFVSYLSARSALIEASVDKLIALAESRTIAIEEYLGSIGEDLLVVASTPFTAEALTSFWKDTDLANAFRAAMEGKKGEIFFFDFEPYAPSADAPASFVSTPVFDKTGTIIGVLAYQMPIGHINKVMRTAAGLGRTGETILIGPDLTMRSDSRFSSDSTILTSAVENEASRAALAGDGGYAMIDAPDGSRKVTVFQPIDVFGQRWAVLAEMDEAEMMAPVRTIRNFALLLVGGSIPVMIILGIVFSRTITRPLTRIVEAMRAVSSGDASVNVPDRERGDEIGDMAKSLEVLKQERIASEAARAEREASEKRIRTETLNNLAGQFRTSVVSLFGRLNDSVVLLGSTANAMSDAVAQTSGQTDTLLSASRQTTANIETVASAAQEMTASIHELKRQIDRATEATNSATTEIEATTTQINVLSESSEEISNIGALIRKIAEQTNLLALNATIEAARAGEAGKGFAVVAQEVKALAEETSKATDSIEQQVAEVRSQMVKAVDAMELIRARIHDVDKAAVAIADAAEEQSNATDEIARSAHGTATNMQALDQGVDQMSRRTGESAKAASKLLEATRSLSANANSINDEIGGFLDNVLAA